MKKAFVATFAAILIAGVVFAQRPAKNVDPGRHPNLARAQTHCQNAFDAIVAAQNANEWDMGGHAQKAKELLSQASSEIKQAALTANANGH